MKWCAERDSNPRPTVCKRDVRVGSGVLGEGVAGALGGGGPTGSCGIVFGTGGTASGSRHPRLVTGRPYGTGACGEIIGGTPLPVCLPCIGVTGGMSVPVCLLCILRSIGDWSKAPTLFWIGAMASFMKRGS